MVSSSLPMLKECCCGCSLKTGTMIIGFITLVWASVLSFIAVNALMNGQHNIVGHKSTADTVLQVSVLAVRVLQAFFSLLLVVASHKEHPATILPWLIIALAAVLVEGTSLTIMLSQLAVGDFNPRIFSMATHVSVTIYFFFVVYSFYREIKTKKINSNKA